MDILCKRFCNLFHALYTSNDNLVSFIARKAIYDCLGVLGSNLKYVCDKYNTCGEQVVKDYRQSMHTNVDCEKENYSHIIRELVHSMDLNENPVLDSDEIQDIVDLLATL